MIKDLFSRYFFYIFLLTQKKSQKSLINYIELEALSFHSIKYSIHTHRHTYIHISDNIFSMHINEHPFFPRKSLQEKYYSSVKICEDGDLHFYGKEP